MGRVQCFLLEKVQPVQTVTRPDAPHISTPIYRRVDNGELMTIHEAPPGAIWRATWYEEANQGLTGADGKSYMCKLPNGTHWAIDGQASNCTKKDDRVHKCCCRHGEAPQFTVDKNGHTCEAGAGSIQSEGYHGFLRNGWLEEC